ncbi:speedy protein E4A isoform X2 [Sarcophilus harrisii]|nr:speedy protein E4A isoform X2 [Sarcophilus harrisii]XP_031800824.1 speedy protein E4A isoform X2 [Sarcophilus harrisii]
MTAGPRTSGEDSREATEEHGHGHGSETTGRRERKRRRYEWTVTEVKDTGIKMKRRRVAPFNSRDLVVLYQLLKNPIIKKFLKTDVKYLTNPKTLLSLVVDYFGLLGFRDQPYSSVHFCMALYSACQLDKVDQSFKWYMLSVILGSNWPKRSSKKKWPMQIEILMVIVWKAWVKQVVSNEVNVQNSGEDLG